jgi:hypothetical protein
MSQVVQTVRAFQTSAGPSLEARVTDANLGDVRVIVTGRAGEMLQAQLVVQNRGAADALVHAAAAMHASSDALAGVNVTVRSESGGSWNTAGRGGNAFESAGWTAGSWGSASGGNSGGASSGDRAGAGLANQAGSGSGSGNGTGGNGTGAGSTPDGSRESARPSANPIGQPSRVAGRPLTRQPLPGGSQGDRRSPLDIRA